MKVYHHVSLLSNPSAEPLFFTELHHALAYYPGSTKSDFIHTFYTGSEDAIWKPAPEATSAPTEAPADNASESETETEADTASDAPEAPTSDETAPKAKRPRTKKKA